MTDVIIAFITAALSGMGVGGGGLFLIYLTLVCGVEQKAAQLSNLVFFIAASAASLTVHVYKRHTDAAVVTVAAAGGVVGALAGASLATVTETEVLRLILGVLLAGSGLCSLFKGEGTPDAVRKRKTEM